MGRSTPPALMASSDESYREESNRCKEARKVQDNLSDEEEDNKDIDEEKNNDRDKEARNAELITASVRRYSSTTNVGRHGASGVAIGQTPEHLWQ